MRYETNNPTSSTKPTSDTGAGFTLIETLAAVFVIAVGITAFFGLFAQSTSLVAKSSTRLTASYLAQEGIEIVRNIRDSNWLKGDPWDNGLSCSNGCQGDYTSQSLAPYNDEFLKIDGGFYNYGSGEPTKFKRKITITSVDSDELKVKVEVFWNNHQVTAQENLYKWLQ